MADKKKILLVDDSALMRRVLCDIIESDERFTIEDRATNGLEAFDLLTRKQYDGVVLDINMPKMNGIELLKELRKCKIPARIMMASTDTRDGAQITLDCLELGATDFVHKPEFAFDANRGDFKEHFLQTLAAVVSSRLSVFDSKPLGNLSEEKEKTRKVVALVKKHGTGNGGNQLVAIASSTGGPKALQSVVPRLPQKLNAPVVIVQHMPVGFTKSLADRLNELSELSVREADEGDVLEPGTVYISKGGAHLNIVQKGGQHVIHYTDEPAREGVKPCANYMFESLQVSGYDRIECVVLTGMGADGTKGIVSLSERKKIHVIAQEESTCAVYGMPKNIVASGKADQVVGLEQIADEIIMNVGVR